MSNHSQEYTAAGNYTFTVPANVSCLFVSAAAGGGAGGATIAPNGGVKAGSAGGGGGELCDNVLLIVTPGGSLSITVGAGGVRNTLVSGPSAVNVHRGPQGNGGVFSDGFGGGNTIVGNGINLIGGYGGLHASNAPHSGIGGGWEGMFSSFIAANNGNCVDNFGVSQGGDGYTIPAKNNPKHFSGSGGGAGSIGVTNNGGRGGHMAGIEYSSGGVSDGTTAGGGGGGSTVYGVGATGGSSESDASSVPAGSYGAGGGGSGGTTNNTGSPRLLRLGTPGADGYVLLTWMEP